MTLVGNDLLPLNFTMPNVPVFDRPRAIIYRFLDVIVTEGRLKHDFMSIASENLQPFLEEFFNHKDMLELIDDLREQSYEERDRYPNLAPPIVFKPTQTPAAIIVSCLPNIISVCYKLTQLTNIFRRDHFVSISTGA